MAFTPTEASQAWHIDDLCRELATARREARAAADLLADAAHALDAGRLEVVAEFIDRSRVHLSRA